MNNKYRLLLLYSNSDIIRLHKIHAKYFSY